MAVLRARLNDELNRANVLEAAFNELQSENTKLKRIIVDKTKEESSSPTPQSPGK